MPCAQAKVAGSASGIELPGVEATVLTEEQKLKDAGVGDLAERQRSMRWRAPAIQSVSNEERDLLKFTDQAQWMSEVILVMRLEYTRGIEAEVGLREVGGEAG